MITKYVGMGQLSTRKEVYHTDENCALLPENIKEVSEAAIEFHDMRECKYCAGEHYHSTAGEGHIQSLREAAKK